MEDNRKNRLFLALIGAAIGVTGIVAYYETTQWMLYTCTFLSILQWVSCMFTGKLQNWAYPYLAACLLAGYYITGSYSNFLCYGICLYYATGLFYSGMLCVIPYQIVFIIAPVISMVAYFLNYEHVFLLTALYCTVNFLITHFQGKHPASAMGVFLLCVALGVGLMTNGNVDSLYSVKIFKGFLWGGAAYYIAMLFYAFYQTYIKKK